MTASMPQQAGPASEGRASDAGWRLPTTGFGPPASKCSSTWNRTRRSRRSATSMPRFILPTGRTGVPRSLLSPKWIGSSGARRLTEKRPAASGQYFFCADGLLARNPGIGSMVRVIARLEASDEFDRVVRRIADPE